MYTHTHLHTYTYTYIHTDQRNLRQHSTHIRTCIHTHTHVYTHALTYIHIHIYTHRSAKPSAAYRSALLLDHAHTYVLTYIRIHSIHTRTHIHTQISETFGSISELFFLTMRCLHVLGPSRYASICVYLYMMHACKRVHTFSADACLLFIHTHIHTCMHTCIYKQSNIRIDMCVYDACMFTVHTYTYTYMYAYMYLQAIIHTHTFLSCRALQNFHVQVLRT
jgi:hypothetical protein